MALRDRIPRDDLLRYLDEVSQIFFYYLEIHHSDAIEGFLSKYSQEFDEWIESELGGEEECRN